MPGETYRAYEGNAESGQPVELVHFAHGSTNWYLTSADEPLSYAAQTYIPDAIRAEAQRMAGEDDDAGIVLILPRLHEIAQLFAVGMPAQPVSVSIVLSHRDILGTGSGTQSEHKPFTGQVESVVAEGDELRMLCLPATSLLRRRLPSHELSIVCYNTLYDTLCGVSRAAFAVTGTITAIAADQKTLTLNISPASFGVGYFIGGWLTHTPSGRKQSIVDNLVGGTAPLVKLLAPIKGTLVGDSIELLPGCKHDEVDCEVKFANGARFGGFARLPSRDPFESGVE